MRINNNNANESVAGGVVLLGDDCVGMRRFETVSPACDATESFPNEELNTGILGVHFTDLRIYLGAEC